MGAFAGSLLLAATLVAGTSSASASAAAQPQTTDSDRQISVSALIGSFVEEALKSLVTYVVTLAGVAALVCLGWWSSGVLGFIVRTKSARSVLPERMTARLAERGARLLLRDAIQLYRKSAVDDSLEAFAAASKLLRQGVKRATAEAILDDPILAPLYAQRAWVDANRAAGLQGSDRKALLEGAITSANRAIRLEPDSLAARTARGWAKLFLGGPADVAEAEQDFTAANAAAAKHGLRYWSALFGGAEASRLQAQYLKAIEQFADVQRDAGDQRSSVLASLGLCYYALGRWQECIDQLAHLLEDDPSHVWGAYCADALRSLGHLDEALAACSVVIKAHPDHEQAYYVAGLALIGKVQQLAVSDPRRNEWLELALRRIQAAKDVALKHHRPVAADVYNKLGEICFLQGRKADAQRWFALARSNSDVPALSNAAMQAGLLAPDGPVTRLTSAWARVRAWEVSEDPADLDLADRDFVSAGDDPGCAPYALAGRAWCRYLRQQLDEALAYAALALESKPDLAVAHYMRGWILSGKGLHREAKAEFSAAVDAGFTIYDTWSGLGNAQSVLGEYDRSVDSYTRGIQATGVPPTDEWKLYSGRAAGHIGLRNWMRAADDYKAAIQRGIKVQIKPQQLAVLYADLAWACYELASDPDMESAAQRALELGPNLVQVQLVIGAIRLYHGDFEAALRAYDAAVHIDGESALAFINRGVTRVYCGELQQALVDLDTAIRKNDRDAIAWQTRGWARLRLGEWDAAVEDLDRSLALGPGNPFAFTDRAVGRWWRNDQRGAFDDLTTALRIKTAELSSPSIERVREDATTWGACAHDWTRAVERSPGDSTARFGRGLCRWWAGDLEAGLTDLRASATSRPRRKSIQESLAYVERERASASTAVAPRTGPDVVGAAKKTGEGAAPSP